jgi:hypothetical protein
VENSSVRSENVSVLPDAEVSNNRSLVYRSLIGVSLAYFFIFTTIIYFFALPGTVLFLCSVLIKVINKKLNKALFYSIVALYLLFFIMTVIVSFSIIPSILFEMFGGDTLRGSNLTTEEIFIQYYLSPSVILRNMVTFVSVLAIGYLLWNIGRLFKKTDDTRFKLIAGSIVVALGTIASISVMIVIMSLLV